jgi:hypothetical protein
VAAAVAEGVYVNGLAHYLDVGRTQAWRGSYGLLDSSVINYASGNNAELNYFRNNLDVALNVARGTFVSAAQHFAEHGLQEGRTYNGIGKESFISDLFNSSLTIIFSPNQADFNGRFEQYFNDVVGNFSRNGTYLNYKGSEFSSEEFAQLNGIDVYKANELMYNSIYKYVFSMAADLGDDFIDAQSGILSINAAKDRPINASREVSVLHDYSGASGLGHTAIAVQTDTGVSFTEMNGYV